jgi:uncharacterized protein with von Willebrand factor type A (vWA) domain
MNEQSLHFPLLDLFSSLRRQGWILGIDDYLSVLEVMETGIGVGDTEQLKQICTLLWTKTPQEAERLGKICDRLKSYSSLFKPPEKPSREPEKEIPPDPKAQVPEEDYETPPDPVAQVLEEDYEIPADPVAKVQAEVESNLVEERAEIAQSIKVPESTYSLPLPSVSYRFRQDYFPLTQREMKQCWRFLRRPVREGIPTELDIKGTIAKVSQEGILTTPVLRPRRINRADLMLLVDQKGSMVPFHPLSRQLIETAQRDGKLRQANVHYFQNCSEYDESEQSYILFQQPTLFQPVLLKNLFTTVNHRTAALIISDAGSARGWLDGDRVKKTEQFLEQLTKSVRYLAWLNPMPDEYWRGTSAEAISQLIPMFPLSRRGFNNAIALLQGRYLGGQER